ncbi:hypothetical protein K32_33390 [Kaistia sp. 32K]|uniref:hypothetical protein n=1 Tax=Kaistia sp. 32K TaxID=2795690 RepID=UPI00191689B5|nr:hypothetical protein [Kaistia sp. 32K]BCP54722.1 hypothetical protein K32_33390 [Kaistia sp. 32K]
MSNPARPATDASALLAILLVAFLWGAAEASYFFVVADVLLTFVAVAYGLRTALAASLAAAIGAACGGFTMWRLGILDPAYATALLRTVPFVSESMIARGMAGMDEANWPLAMLKGSVTGVPYKVYAVAAGKEGLSALFFFGATIPIRLSRFVVAVSVVAGISAGLQPRLALRGRLMLLAIFWILFYGEFWWRWFGMDIRLF